MTTKLKEQKSERPAFRLTKLYVCDSAKPFWRHDFMVLRERPFFAFGPLISPLPHISHTLPHTSPPPPSPPHTLLHPISQQRYNGCSPIKDKETLYCPVRFSGFKSVQTLRFCA